MTVIQDDLITSNNIQPALGQSLTIKDEGGTASITVATNGEATFAENIIVGTAGKGISFQSSSGTGTSSTSNTLHDYEEGTFSGVVKLGSTDLSAGGASYWRYTRIGNVVHIWGESTTISKASATGNLTITGLPYASVSGEMNINGQLRWNGITSSQGVLIPVIGPGESVMTIQDMSTNGYNSTITHSSIGSSTFNIYSINANYRTS